MSSDPSANVPSPEYQEAMAAWLRNNPSPDVLVPAHLRELPSVERRNVELQPPAPLPPALGQPPMDAEQQRRWYQQEDLQAARAAGMFALALLSYESGSGWKFGGEVEGKARELLLEVIARLRAGLDA